MPPTKSKSKAGPSLKSGRPLLLTSANAAKSSTTSTLSSKHTRTLIRSHHTLLKRLAQARSDPVPDEDEIKRIEGLIERQGGLEKYQEASRWGQDSRRGGDSSQVLVEWLKEDCSPGVQIVDSVKKGLKRKREEQVGNHDEIKLVNTTKPTPTEAIPPISTTSVGDSLRVLEVGSLHPENAISKYRPTPSKSNVTMHRIDLHSSHPLIQEIDFMDLPIPLDSKNKHDIVSLSLVVNFVDDPIKRGEMLKRTREFLRLSDGEEDYDENRDHRIVDRQGSVINDATSTSTNINTKDINTDIDNNVDNDIDTTTATNKTNPQSPPLKPINSITNSKSQRILPALFLVLPLPCISNSRYLTPKHLQEMMLSLNYHLSKLKTSAKLHYSLWTYRPANSPTKNPGKSDLRIENDTRTNNGAVGGNKQILKVKRLKKCGGNDLDSHGTDQRKPGFVEDSNTKANGNGNGDPNEKRFAKKILRPGGGRNNFAIVLG